MFLSKLHGSATWVTAAWCALGAGLVEAQPCPATFFSDDFESYADDAALAAAGWQIVQANSPAENASWTVANPCGRRNPPTVNGSPSIGKFVISDSDCADGANSVGTGMSHDLITPTFSTLGGTTVWVHASCNAQLNNGADAIFDVDVSIDGGANWTNVSRRVSPGRAAAPASDTSNADGFFGRFSVDITAQAAGQAAVQVRFRHFEPTDDWWVALDDVVVSCDAPPAGGNCTILGTQGFSGGLGAMSAVSLAGNTGTETWGTADKGNRYVAGAVSGRGVNRINQPNAAKEFAILESAGDPDPAEDEYLRTPTLNCTNFERVFLHWQSETVLDDNATQEVLASLDGGASYPIVVFRYNLAGGAANALFDDGEESFYAQRVFEVPEAAGQSRVVFAFHYQSPGNEQFWAIDDVQVTGTAPLCDPRDCGLRSFAAEYDPATNKVTGTWNTLPGDAGFRVLQGEREVASLSGAATSFEDTTPPVGGSGVVYSLETLIDADEGPGVELVAERTCLAPALETFVCTGAFASRADVAGKTVSLTWTPAINAGLDGYLIRRNGLEIAALGPTASSHSDAPALPATREHVLLNYELIGVTARPNPCSVLATRAILSSGTVCYAEDFEDYANDVSLEVDGGWFRVDEVTTPPGESATWTLSNPGGRSNPPTFDGSPSTGRFAISDSDAAGGDNGAPGNGNSNDLWSPPFSTLGKSAVWLHMDTSAVLNNNGKVVFDIDVSSDGGASWTNVYRRVAPSRTEAPPVASVTNADGFFGALHVDLSAIANRPSAQFRVRSFEPSDDWWIAIDNVIVDDVPGPSGGTVDLFSEDFSAGLGSMTAVSLAGNSGTETWNVGDKCVPPRSVVGAGGVFPIRDGRGVHRLAPPYAILESECDPDPAEDEYLATPALDCSGLTSVYLHYKSETVPGDTSIEEVLISLDGGDTFSSAPLFSYKAGGLVETGEEPMYADRVLAAPQAAGNSNVVFAFHYRSPGNQRFWALDDVRVTGTPACLAGFGVTIDGPTDGLVGESVVLTASSNATAPVTRLWQIVSGPGAISGSATEESLAIDGTGPGDVTVRLTVTDACGTPASDEHVVTFGVSGGAQKPFDMNQDGRYDLSDSVSLLGFLFLGGVAPPCGDGSLTHAANLTLLDANGDGRVDLSDAVYALGFLFLGGPRPVNCSDDTCPCISVADCPDNSDDCN